MQFGSCLHPSQYTLLCVCRCGRLLVIVNYWKMKNENDYLPHSTLDWFTTETVTALTVHWRKIFEIIVIWMTKWQTVGQFPSGVMESDCVESVASFHSIHILVFPWNFLQTKSIQVISRANRGRSMEADCYLRAPRQQWPYRRTSLCSFRRFPSSVTNSVASKW